jgi:hypothetical protein
MKKTQKKSWPWKSLYIWYKVINFNLNFSTDIIHFLIVEEYECSYHVQDVSQAIYIRVRYNTTLML